MDDALRLSCDLTSRPDADTNNGDVVTATVRSATSTVDGWKSSPPASTHSIAALFASGVGSLGQAQKHSQSSHLHEAVSDKPSILVLPFTNMSGDPEQEYFADGLTEDFITELSRYKGLRVLARHTSFHYKGKSPKIELLKQEHDVGVCP